MKRLFQFFALALMSLGVFAPAQAAELTVFDGTDLDRTLPINIYWLDGEGTRSQVIYPAEELTALVGRPINSMKFYLDGSLDAADGVVNVSLGVVDQTKFTENAFFEVEMTRVATISFTPGDTELLITFDEPYVYNGGNLLLDTYVQETGSYGTVYFYGVNPYYSAGKSRSQQVSFIPKTTFEFEPADNGATVSPLDLKFKPIRAGEEEWMNVVVTNVGKNPFTPSFSVQEPFATTTRPVELQPGEELVIHVLFAPTVDGDFNQVMTVDCDAAGTFDVNISAKALPEADEFTVCDATNSMGYLPVYGFYYDYAGGVGQMIYPAEMLTDMVGKEIFALTFYPRDGSLAFGGGAVQVSLKETEQTAFESETPITDMTAVCTVVPEKGAELWEIVFDEPYKYMGGNLVIGTLVTQEGEYGSTYFYGLETDNYSAYYTYSSSWGTYGNTAKFLPKVTFACKKEGGEQPVVIRGDVDGNEDVTIADVTALIDILLSGSEAPDAADCNLDGEVSIADVTTLIDYLLGGQWPE